MNHLTLLYSTRNNPVSGGIRVATWSKWSHVGVVDYATGEVIESVMIHGVRAIPIGTAMSNAARYELANIRCNDPARALALIRAQIGKYYDYSALWGLALHRDWQNEDKQFCSELIAWGIESSGTQLFRPESMHRVTPEDLYRQSYC